MSYAHRKRIGASRTFAIAIVALTHAGLGCALVNGLAYTVIQKAPESLKTFNVEEVLPPPEVPPPAPKEVAKSKPPVVAPPPLVRTPVAPTVADMTVPEARPPAVATAAVVPTPPEPTYVTQAPPPAPPIVTVPPRSATGDLQRLFRGTDYPLAAVARREQGSVTVRLTVGVMGRVGACDVMSSSGSRALDNASCQVLQTRAVFTPARDSSSNPTTDTVDQEVRWVIS